LFTKVTKKVTRIEKPIDTYVTMTLEVFDELMDAYIRDEESKLLP